LFGLNKSKVLYTAHMDVHTSRTS